MRPPHPRPRTDLADVAACDAAPDEPPSTASEDAPRPLDRPATSGVTLDVSLRGDCLPTAEYSFELARCFDGRVVAEHTYPLHIDRPTCARNLHPGVHHYAVSMYGALLFEDTIELGPGGASLTFDCGDLPGLEVSVMDEAGSPIAGADIALEAWHVRPFAPIAVESDAHGRASIAPLPPHGEYVLTVDAATSSLRRAGPVLLSAAAPRAAVDVDLEPSLRLSGRVVCPDGTPVVGARVTARQGRVEPHRTTDGDGRFAFDDVSSGPVRLRVEAGHFPSLAVDVDARECDDISLRLSPPAYVHGVVHTHSPPHERVRLHAAPLDLPVGSPLAQDYPIDVSDDGSFVLGPLPAGRCELRDLHDPSFMQIVTTDHPVDVTLAPWHTHTVDMVLVDAAGSPIVGAVVGHVALGGHALQVLPERTTDDDGRVSVRWRSVGHTADVHLAVDGYAPVVLSGVDARDEAPRTVVLADALETELFVTASRDGRPVEGADVILRWRDDEARFRPGALRDTHSVALPAGEAWQQRLTTDAEGRVVVPAGRAALDYVVSSPGTFAAAGTFVSGQPRVAVTLDALDPPDR